MNYDNSVSYYVGNDEASLKIDDNYEGNNVEVWLGGNDGNTYKNVKEINAKKYTGPSILVGNNANSVIRASESNSSLWGGATGDDTLIDSDNYNEFFYLKDNSNDTYTNENDIIKLCDISLEDISSADLEGLSINIKFADGGSLSTKAFGNVTFELSDGSKWQANTVRHKWKKFND